MRWRYYTQFRLSLSNLIDFNNASEKLLIKRDCNISFIKNSYAWIIRNRHCLLQIKVKSTVGYTSYRTI